MVLSEIERENIIAPFREYLNEDTPGYQLAVCHNGEIILSYHCGKAILEIPVDVNRQTMFEAGSVTKQFTAASVLLLEQQGKLSLQDPITKFLPELSEKNLKIFHLLYHTSGLRDWGSITTLTGWPRGTKAFTNEDVLEITRQQEKLNNQPNSKFIYSNTNYNLLAIIVERVAGMYLNAFTHKYIFLPAGMGSTVWRHFTSKKATTAISYRKDSNSYNIDDFLEFAYGNSGILTTAEDLIKWNNFYLSGSFGKPPLNHKQLSSLSLDNGEPNYYAAGLYVKQKKGLLNVFHAGSTASYRCFLEAFPEKNISIAWLSNTSAYENEIAKIFDQLEDILLANVDSEKVNHYFVDNIFQETPHIFNFDYDQNLILSESPHNSNQRIESLHIETGFLEFIGKYYSDETCSFITIMQNEEKLKLYLRPSKTYEINKIEIDKFSILGINGVLEFERNELNVVCKMIISIPRAYNILFHKVPYELK